MSRPHVIQAASASPPQPAYVLRGHNAQVHSVHFLRLNTRLLTGDANGWIILWDLVIKRPVAVWRGHSNAILSIKTWGEEKIITHGRDNSLRVWQLRISEESNFSIILPNERSESGSEHHAHPWLLHLLPVNTLNFCAFAMCYQNALAPWGSSKAKNADEVEDANFLGERSSKSIEDSDGKPTENDQGRSVQTRPESSSRGGGILIAVPGTRDASIDIFSLPSERRVSTVSLPKSSSGNLTMALSLFHPPPNPYYLYLISGHESGTTRIHALPPQPDNPTSKDGINPTSAAWTCIYTTTLHTQPVLSLCTSPKLMHFYTSGADDLIAMHCIPFPPLPAPFASTDPSYPNTPSPAISTKTKHSGQQSLALRSDGRIFATAGWDGCARVYNAKTLKELAVLKWHQEGCYAVAFAELFETTHEMRWRKDAVTGVEPEGSMMGGAWTGSVSWLGGGGEGDAKEPPSLAQARRIDKVRRTHYIAAGSKDGKVSLWDIY
ncbi:WD40 repeat-like protein [Aulographum hederae CBS 113979]|uniref:ASTRA-associated protein 1 n=1 Tax=Aulographum hederae CBS 113979 TaxID=1176131 RepID=A0A6G1GW90_9PEZI|nr:WD40 repeat-like protein [Aulographum hederae CBS 113979]